MKNYLVKKISEKDFNSNTWDNIESIHIENFPWCTNGYKPKTIAKFIYTEKNFRVKFISYDNPVRAENLNLNDPVYEDSCVEFFFKPNFQEDDRYFNFEINAIGTLLLQLDDKTGNRSFLPHTDVSKFEIKSSIKNGEEMGYWGIEYKIPFEFIKKYFGNIEFKSSHVLKGNFYKCGDKTEKPHYGCWNEIENEFPAFHKPEFFGNLILE